MSVTAEELTTMRQQLQTLESERAEMNLRLARSDAYAKHPHLRDLGLLEQYVGSPEQIGAFADKLAESIPPPAPAQAPLTQAPGGVLPPTQPTQPAPVVQQQPPAVTNPPPPPAAPAPPPQSLAAPTPSPGEMTNQQTADMAKADEIRQKMMEGMATRAEAQWLSQNAPRREVDLGDGRTGMSAGFTAAVRQFGAERRARLGV